MTPQTDDDLDFITREDAHAMSRRQLQSHHKAVDGDCGCKKDYPFADILPKDESYIDFTKNKEIIGMVVHDIGMKCSNVMTFVHNLKNHYPGQILDSNIDGLDSSVETLRQTLAALKQHLESREELARDVLKSDGTWVRRSK